MLTLSVETDEGSARNLRIERFPARIGRRPDSAVHLPGWRVARVHAEIVRIEQGFKLVDRGSLGGTWVNGERIAEYAPLAEDDEIEIAGYRVRVHRAGEDAAHIRHGDAQRADADPADAHGIRAHGREAQRTSTLVPSDGLVPWRRLLHRRLLATIDLRRQDIRQLSAEQLHAEIEALLREIAHGERALPEHVDRDRLAREVLDEAIGLGPLEPLLRDETISEIMVNAPDEIFVERNGRLEATGASFTGEDAVRAAIDRIVAPLGRRIDESSPMVDARLPDGSRVNAVIPPLAVRGPAITIRRFNRRLFSPADLVANGSLSQPMLDFLAVCVRSRRNVVVSGGTGSGKTTLLNLLSNLIEPGQRVVTIEDAAELRLAHAQAAAVGAVARGAGGKSEAVHFSGHRVSGDLAELVGQQAGAQSVSPELLELLDPLIVPDHTSFLLRRIAARCRRAGTRCHIGPGRHRAADGRKRVRRHGKARAVTNSGTRETLYGDAFPDSGVTQASTLLDGRCDTRAPRPAHWLTAFLPNISCRSRPKVQQLWRGSQARRGGTMAIDNSA